MVISTFNLNIEIGPPQWSLNTDLGKLTPEYLREKLLFNAATLAKRIPKVALRGKIFKFRPQGAQPSTNLQILLQRLFKSIERLKLGISARKKWCYKKYPFFLQIDAQPLNPSKNFHTWYGEIEPLAEAHSPVFQK